MKNLYRLLSLIIIAANVGCAAQPAGTATPQVRATTTAASTAAPSPTTTLTVEPATSNATATDIPLPTLTPAVRAASPSAYHLAAETAGQADEAITRIEQAIESIEDTPPPTDLSNSQEPDYVPYYRATWYAAWNAVAHFPQNPRAEAWHWKMAHYMALAGDIDEANQAYSDLITSVLNSDKASIADLPNHVLLGNAEDTLYRPAFVMQVKNIPIPHVKEAYIATLGNLNDPDTPIAACFLITRNADKDGSETHPYSTFFIQNSFVGFGFSTMRRDSIDCSAMDVTGDGVDEIVTNRYSGGHQGSFTFQVFDVSSLPPRPLLFTNAKGESSFETSSADFVDDFPAMDGKPQIHLDRSLGVYDCRNLVHEYFQWTGKAFELVRQDFQFGLPPDVDISPFCMDDALGGQYNLDAKDAAGFLEQAIAGYRPYAGQMGGMFDEFILRLGVDYALQGETQKARSSITEVVQTPSVKTSVWIEPARKFLELYQQPGDLYRAASVLISCTPYREMGSAPNNCAKISLFDKAALLDYTLKNIYPSISLDKVTASLKESGVQIATEGQFDFDGDGKAEVWFTSLGPREDGFDLWVVAEALKGNAIFEAGFYSPDDPQPTWRVKHSTAHPHFIQLDEDGYDNFELIRDPKTGEPGANSWSAQDEQTDYEKTVYANLGKFRELRQALMQNSDPASAYRQIQQIDQQYTSCPFKRDEAQASVYVLDDYYDCAAFYYTLAFASELSGQKDEALKRYYAIWAVYPNSPFATLARLKLAR